MQRTILGLFLLLCLSATAWADYEAAMTAYKKADYATALRELKPLAEQGDMKAQNTLGWMYKQGQGVPQDYNEAMKWFRKAADQGLAKAQVNIGLMYESGTGVTQDNAEAFRWFQKAADQGDAWGQNNLGMLYKEGKGVPQNYVQAYFWASLAAAQGLEKAVSLREDLSKLMTPAQISKAQEMSANWKPQSSTP